MRFLLQADQVLSRCEHELRSLGASAFQDGAYEEARRISDQAEAVAAHRLESVHVGGDSNGATRADTIQQSLPTPVSRSTTPTQGTSKSVKPSRSPQYPRFAREGDRLVKIGWSKKDRAEYEHKAPFTAVAAFLAHLRAKREGGRPFSIDALMPVPDPSTGSEMPSYQVYLVLAWLRQVGIIKKRSRDSYVHNNGKPDQAAIMRELAALPQR